MASIGEDLSRFRTENLKNANVIMTSRHSLFVVYILYNMICTHSSVNYYGSWNKWSHMKEELEENLFHIFLVN